MRSKSSKLLVDKVVISRPDLTDEKDCIKDIWEAVTNGVEVFSRGGSFTYSHFVDKSKYSWRRLKQIADMTIIFKR